MDLPQAAIAFERRLTGHAPKWVTVVLSEGTLVVTLQGALSPPRTAKALRLRYFEGMRLGAIEKELGGLSKRRIRQILEMGLEALGDILD